VILIVVHFVILQTSTCFVHLLIHVFEIVSSSPKSAVLIGWVLTIDLENRIVISSSLYVMSSFALISINAADCSLLLNIASLSGMFFKEPETRSF